MSLERAIAEWRSRNRLTMLLRILKIPRRQFGFLRKEPRFRQERISAPSSVRVTDSGNSAARHIQRYSDRSQTVSDSGFRDSAAANGFAPATRRGIEDCKLENTLSGVWHANSGTIGTPVLSGTASESSVWTGVKGNRCSGTWVTHSSYS